MLTGQIHTWHAKLHTQYGPVVRTGPHTLSYAHTAGWKEIYGLRKDAKLAKDPEFYIAQPNGVFSILSANDENHSRFRRVFSHAFSDKALKEQQPLFMQYLNLLVRKLNEKIEAQPEEGINMVSMLNFTTFDIMADLTFGAPLGMLASSEYHPWVSTIFTTVKLGTLIRALCYLPLFNTMKGYLLPKSLVEKRRAHFGFSSAQVNRRLSRELDRPDIWNLVLKKKEQEGGLSLDEMHANAALFMAAGTETTATELSGTLYYLMKNPDKMALLVEEIRTEFPNDEDISMERLPQIKYLHACLEEGLRIYPPVPFGLPRVAPKEGATILGEYIPPNVRATLFHIPVHLLSCGKKFHKQYSSQTCADPSLPLSIQRIPLFPQLRRP
jgi:cytochrome P450